MSESDIENEDPEDVKQALAPIHEKWLALGRLLAGRLEESVQIQLDAPEEMDRLRYEFRHAPSLVNATAAEIRCAVAITEFSLALEIEVFQKRKGKLPEITLFGGNVIRVGDKNVPKDYLMARIIDALFCKPDDVDQIVSQAVEQAIDKLFCMLVSLLQLQILFLPNFDTKVGHLIRLVYIER